MTNALRWAAYLTGHPFRLWWFSASSLRPINANSQVRLPGWGSGVRWFQRKQSLSLKTVAPVVHVSEAINLRLFRQELPPSARKSADWDERAWSRLNRGGSGASRRSANAEH